ncbi:MAG: DedA family protein [Lacisediminihabitans sp.]
MGAIVDSILGVNAVLAYVLVFLLVFAEDALFVGFVLPGETAAVLGGVVASRGHVQLWLMIVLVVAAAITGDSVGYEVGKHFGPKILELRLLQKRRASLDKARDFLRRRGGGAVFLGRFVAFFRAVMPALAGISHMPYRRFLPYNAAGGIAWGTGFVLLGFLAGNSYALVAKTVGRDTAVVVVLVVVAAFVVWRIRKHRTAKATGQGQVPRDPGSGTGE